ncbi:MAG TPA: flagellar basal body-associated FliL family protein [Thermodesulfobacteriota bacterium]|nr:flagellar basal body-associated FliL family protein [Thermodesulfobacteriota bacterium]
MSTYGEDEKKKDKKAGNDEKGSFVPGFMYPMETFIVNLSGDNAKRYLRVTMQMELSDEKVKQEMEQRMPMVRDMILTILPTKTAAELLETEGKSTMRDMILNRVNGVLTTGTVKNLYFTEFVIQ